MPQSSSSISRILAPAALVVAAIVLIVVIGSSLGGSETPGNGRSADSSNRAQNEESEAKPSKVQRSAIRRGFYVVEEGDTLVDISSATGVSVEELQDLNEDLDPQRLMSGQKVFLRPK